MRSQARKREGQWLGSYHSYNRLSAHTQYLHFLRNRKSEMPKVEIALVAAGAVEDYPRNVTAAMKRKFAAAAGVPSFGVKIRVTSASVRAHAPSPPTLQPPARCPLAPTRAPPYGRVARCGSR